MVSIIIHGETIVDGLSDALGLNKTVINHTVKPLYSGHLHLADAFSETD